MNYIQNVYKYTKAYQRVAIAKEYYGFDLRKDYFELLPIEDAQLGNFRTVCNFRGKNNLGRSANRQFWYYLQKEFRRQEELKEKLGLPF